MKVAGFPFRVRLATLPNGDLAGLRVLDPHPQLAVVGRVPQVVNVRGRDARQSLEPLVPVDRELPPQQVSHRRAGQILVGRVCLGQQGDVGGRAASRETQPPRRLPLDPPPLHPALDQPRQLGATQATELAQKPPHDAFLPLAEATVVLDLQHPLDKAVGCLLLHCRAADVSMVRHEFFHLGQAEPFQVVHADCHLPAA